MIMASVLFLLSALFLANTLLYPAESTPYKIGQLLCFLVTPIFLIAGIFVFEAARRAEKKEKPIAAPQAPVSSGETSFRACSQCGRDLPQLPAEIVNCPYCGRPVSAPPKPESGKPEEALLVTGKLRRCVKITALLGLIIAIASFPLAIALSSSTLLNGILVGICIMIASGYAWKLEKGLIIRRTIGLVMIAVPIAAMFFGGPPFLPFMYAPGLIIAVFLLTSRRRGVYSSVIVLLGAFAYAALWLFGLFPGTLIDGSWMTVLYQMWSPRFAREAGLETLVLLWTLQLEKTLALTAGMFLLLTSFFSRIKTRTRITMFAAFGISLLPLLLLAPPPTRGIEGGAVLKVTVLAVDNAPISELEVDVGKEPGPPPEGGVMTTDVNGTATFYIRPGSYIVYFNQAAFPSDLLYPNKLYQVDVSEDRLNTLTIFLNYSSPGLAAPSGYSVWLTRVDDPNATRLTTISSGEQVYIWVQGPVGDSSEFRVFVKFPNLNRTQIGLAQSLDPSGEPVSRGFRITIDSPCDVTLEIQIQRKVVASVTFHVG